MRRIHVAFLSLGDGALTPQLCRLIQPDCVRVLSFGGSVNSKAFKQLAESQRFVQDLTVRASRGCMDAETASAANSFPLVQTLTILAQQETGTVDAAEVSVRDRSHRGKLVLMRR